MISHFKRLRFSNFAVGYTMRRPAAVVNIFIEKVKLESQLNISSEEWRA